MKNNSIINSTILLFFAGWFVGFAQNVTQPKWSSNSIIYEANIRQFSINGTFKAFQEKLPEIKELGVDIIWLMPINPIGVKNRKGSLGSYYAVKDYKSVNTEFGSPADLKELIRKSHELGFKIIIDWVANHTSWDNELLKTNPEFFKKNDKGEFYAPFENWADVVQLNYENKGLRKYMTESMLYWIKEFDIDGFRCDVAGMVPIDFWVEARKEIEKIKPVFMLAEWEDPKAALAFNMDYATGFHQLMNQIAQGKKKGSEVYKWIDDDLKKYPKGFARMHFISNHDENTWAGTEYERLGEAVKAFTVLSYVIPGMPLIYTGQEVQNKKRIKFFDKDTIDWNGGDLRNFYFELAELKKKYRSLGNGENSGEFIPIPIKGEEDVIAFIRKTPTDRILCVFNLSSKEKKVELNQNILTGEFADHFTASCKEVTEKMKLTLYPWGFKIWESK